MFRDEDELEREDEIEEVTDEGNFLEEEETLEELDVVDGHVRPRRPHRDEEEEIDPEY